MYLLRSVDVWSCARLMGVFYGCIGLLAIPMMFIAIIASAASGQRQSALGTTALILVSLLAPVFYGVLGFLLGALTAWLYNVAAKQVGGLRLHLQDENTIVKSAKGVGLI
jgi:Na+/H+-dicarboxylate symporter